MRQSSGWRCPALEARPGRDGRSAATGAEHSLPSSRTPGPGPPPSHGDPHPGGSGDPRPCGVRPQQPMCQWRRWKNPRDERIPLWQLRLAGRVLEGGEAKPEKARSCPGAHLPVSSLPPRCTPPPFFSFLSRLPCLCVCVSECSVRIFSPKKEARVCCFVTSLGVGKYLAVQ